MIYQISSGQGPAECELGVAKLLDYLQTHYDTTLLDASPDIMRGLFARSGFTQRRIYRNTPVLSYGSAEVRIVPATGGRTGFWTFTSAKQLEPLSLIRSRWCSTPFGAAVRAVNMSTK